MFINTNSNLNTSPRKRLPAIELAGTKQIMVDQKELKGIVRLVDKDIIGEVPIRQALTLGKGISFMMSNAICIALSLNPLKEVGYFSSEELKKIEDCARNPANYGIPTWMFNARKDIETGENKHLISADLDLKKTFDIRLMKKIKCYKGVRHSLGSKKVRGQRTRTCARKRKSTLGVKHVKKSSGK